MATDGRQYSLADCKLADFNLAVCYRSANPPIRQIKIPAKFTGYTVCAFLLRCDIELCLTSSYMLVSYAV